jgi:hypothetical protein
MAAEEEVESLRIAIRDRRQEIEGLNKRLIELGEEPEEL